MAAIDNYMTGFGNEFATEAVSGALPEGMNSPQRAPLGLYAEKFSATAFTAPRADNFRSWFYRIRPSVLHGDFKAMGGGLIRTSPIDEVPTTPNQLRWDPLPMPGEPADFILRLKYKIVGGNSGVQFRSERRPDFDTHDYQADLDRDVA